MTVQDPSKRRVSNTNINNTNISNTENLISQSKTAGLKMNEKKRMTDGQTEYESVSQYFEKQVFEEVRAFGTYDQLIDDIKLNLLDMYFSPEIMINGDRRCQDLVRAALMRLEPIHIDNVIYKFTNVNSRIVNKKAYIQTMLYNESLETNLFMHNQVTVDQADWKD